MSAAMVALLVLACLGWGGLGLRGLGLMAELAGRPGVRATLAFALGHGMLGWGLFFVGLGGLLQPGVLLGLLLAPLPFLDWLRRDWARPAEPWSRVDQVLVALLAAVALLAVIQALAPPSDADTLAYHFALPRQFLAAGRIEFVPRAVDGAIPLLVQMTYVPALALGGETALTLWSCLSAWAAALLMAMLARPHLGRGWTLALTLALVTMPAFVYGAASGQVEAKAALYGLLAAWALGRGLTGGGLRHVVLAGLAAGFFMATKYTGLLFVAACALVLLRPHPGGFWVWLGRGLACGLAVLAAGGQWYAWNWMNTGDPVFPMLFNTLHLPDGPFWNAAHDAYFRQQFTGVEVVRPTNLLWALIYPIEATLAGLPQYESLRTGFGPLPLLLAPLAVAGAWRRRRAMAFSPLLIWAALALGFYLLWFLTGSSQRIRHLLPVLPLALPVLLAAALRVEEFRRPLVAALTLVLGLHLAGDALFSALFVKRLVKGEDRSTFLAHTVPLVGPVQWINANLPPGAKLFYQPRQFAYLLDVPAVMGHQVDYAVIETSELASDPALFVRQLRGQGVTHVLAFEFDAASLRAGLDDTGPLGRLVLPLLERGCLVEVKTFTARQFASRTLSSGIREMPASLMALNLEACQ